MKAKFVLLALVIGLGSASASSIFGILGLGDAGGVQATINSIYFQLDPSANPSGAPWNSELNLNTTLDCSGVGCDFTKAGLQGAALSATNNAVSVNNNTPFSGGIPIDYFFKVSIAPKLDFELTGVTASGASNNCAAATLNGQTCSLNIAGSTSPIVLTADGSGGSTASITFTGCASDLGFVNLPCNGPSESTWSGTFSATIPNMTPDQIALFFCSDYNNANACTPADVAFALANPQTHTLTITSNSGSFNAIVGQIVPEPSSTVFLGGGLLLLSLGFRRLQRRHRA